MRTGGHDRPPVTIKRSARGPVSRVLSTLAKAGDGRPFLYGTDCSVPPATNPGGEPEQAHDAAPIRSCSRWGLPCRRRCRRRGALLPHPFDLTGPKAGGVLSVALSLTPAEAGAAGRYPAPSFRGARTFLGEASFDAAARPSGPPHIAVCADFSSRGIIDWRMPRHGTVRPLDHWYYRAADDAFDR